ncbi:MAG: saccharopine dehydrogenase C-terminal domain-containing protein [Acidobacteriota bacterium]
MSQLVVLGGGRVGAAMARDLARDGRSNVVLADRSRDALDRVADASITPRHEDLSTAEGVRRAVEGARLAIGAVPGPMGFAVARRVLEAGVDLVDISFFEEDAFELADVARRVGRVCVVDAGVAPGLSNLVLGRAEASWERVDRFVCYVGGLPIARRLPWQYKAPFSPIDVLAEYTRPARLREDGRLIERPALGGVETIEIESLGTLEAFETDGLRTILRTSEVPTLVEKTLRYPGHRDRIELLRDAGFLDEHPVELPSGVKVVPLELAAALLFPQWQLEDGEPELTAMRLVVEGIRDGRRQRETLDLLDRTDRTTGTSSMARTTGYTATAVARVVADGLWTEPGVAALEHLGRDEAIHQRVLEDLEARGVVFERRVLSL